MATALFMVKATIDRKHERAFNRWYNREHVPQVLRYPGFVSARRYRKLLGDDRYQYLAVYELESERTLRAFLRSKHLEALKREYDRHFGRVSERVRLAYTQVWP